MGRAGVPPPQRGPACAEGNTVSQQMSPVGHDSEPGTRCVHEYVNGFSEWTISPSSAVRRSALLICKDLRVSKPGFLHYILQGIFNDAALLWQVQAQML